MLSTAQSCGLLHWWNQRSTCLTSVLKTLPATRRLLCCWSTSRMARAFRHVQQQWRKPTDWSKVAGKLGQSGRRQNWGKAAHLVKGQEKGGKARWWEQTDRVHKEWIWRQWTLVPFSGPIHHPKSMQTCASKTAGTGPSRPPLPHKQKLPYPEECSATAPACRLQW